MRIILIGNYPPDKQESMERFAQMLASGFHKAGLESEIWRPFALFGGWSKTPHSGIGKWLGYFDKWVVFPVVLRWRLLHKALNSNTVRFHLCDHSNAPYLAYLPSERVGVTCHDVLAIRGALGYDDAYCQASATGKVLQKWILRHLSHAKRLATVSQLTLNQLQELAPQPAIDGPTDWRVIHNGFNATFAPMPEEQREALLSKLALHSGVPFLLHVGSGLPRKNRKLLLQMVHALGDKWQGNICFAGEALEEELLAQAELLGLRHRVVEVVKPSHETLTALYSACEAFVFPSFSEGFGWPVIEAQACGAPVIASNIEPMPEVSGGTALHADPAKPQEFAEALLTLQQEGVREKVVAQGFQNAHRFGASLMIDAYLDLYGIK